MNDLFVILSYLSTLAFFVGLVKPSIFSGLLKERATRKGVVIIFGFATMGFSILSSITSGVEEKPVLQVDTSAQRALARLDVPSLVFEMNKNIAAGDWDNAAQAFNRLNKIAPDHPRLINARISIEEGTEELKRVLAEGQAREAERVAAEKAAKLAKAETAEAKARKDLMGCWDEFNRFQKEIYGSLGMIATMRLKAIQPCTVQAKTLDYLGKYPKDRRDEEMARVIDALSQ